ncbi:dimethylmenaquinone methyltransferase [Achromatium sp. WMS2]|nr:dimethylmenaquinone methyltransferase [Achromatium sp. WMS2]
MQQPHSELTKQQRQHLIDIFGDKNLLTDPTDCWTYGYDNSRRQALPHAVVFITDTQQALELVKFCNGQRLPLIARGRGTGTTGATVPDQGGIVASFERMQRIIEIIPDDRLAIVEPGVTNQNLQQALAKHGFFWPPDPSSAAACTIGGNLAYNAAGPRAVKYGTPRENTLGLQIITGAGQLINCGVNTTKGVVGYDLTRLIIGSEGTLALITAATLKLTPCPETIRTIRVLYQNLSSATQAVAKIMAQPIIPCALEFMDATAVRLANEYGNLGLDATVQAMLIIEVDGPEHCIEANLAKLTAITNIPGLISCDIAQNADAVAQLWQARKALSPALRKIAPKKINEDVVVPVSKIPAFINRLDKLSLQHDITIVNFGHAGNGNIHVNLLVNPDDTQELARAELCLSAVFDAVLELGGTISGEHGVGLAKRDFVVRELSGAALGLMHRIKQQFDPNNILNPGKTLPEWPIHS